MGTEIKQTANGTVCTWAPDFALNWRGYWIYGAPQRDKWVLGTPEGQRFGRHYNSYAEAAAAVDMHVQADADRDNSPWYAGCDWPSQTLQSHMPADADGEEVMFHNGAGPGSAYQQAQALFNRLCQEPGGHGTCWWGRVTGYGTPEESTAQEAYCDRDPQDEEAERQRCYDQYLEDNHDAIVAQERYAAQQAEY